MIDQISIYTENRRGAAREILGILARDDINILCLVNSDSGEFGTMRLIVSDSVKAMNILKENGYLCKKETVIASEMEDAPGSLEKFLLKFEEMNINVDYMYVGYSRDNNMPVIIVRCQYMDIVETQLKAAGYRIH